MVVGVEDASVEYFLDVVDGAGGAGGFSGSADFFEGLVDELGNFGFFGVAGITHGLGEVVGANEEDVDVFDLKDFVNVVGGFFFFYLYADKGFSIGGCNVFIHGAGKAI